MLVFSPDQSIQIGTAGFLHLDTITCNRCFGKVPGPGMIEATYLGKNEDGFYHDTCSEFRLHQPIPCPFCMGVMTTMYMKEPVNEQRDQD